MRSCVPQRGLRLLLPRAGRSEPRNVVPATHPRPSFGSRHREERSHETIQRGGARQLRCPTKPNRRTGLLRFARNDHQEKREAERRQTCVQPPHLARGTRRSGALACRRSTAALPRDFRPRAQLQAMFPGTWQDVRSCTVQPTGAERPRALRGRYPRPPVPVQGCTSRTGRSAGQMMPEAARERTAKPGGSTALAPCSGVPREHDPQVSEIRMSLVSDTVTSVNGKVIGKERGLIVAKSG